ncbi:MAG: FAD-dependent oxidoreductase [Clostridia bacterium]|nr:FAD-dependent oxidoreductase [Clostridia bacterium]
MSSIWTKEIDRPQFEELKQDIKTDVLIIGGGITGILCGYMLKKEGVDCVLVEADKICSGITKNTTAKISCIHGLICDKMIARYGKDVARLYMEAQTESLEQYRKLAEIINCDFETADSFVFTKKNRAKIEKEAAAFEKIGYPAVFSENLSLPFSIECAVGIKNQAQFHPLKLLFEIAKDITIYENTKVIEIRPDVIVTSGGKIKASKIIVATHFPFLNKHGSYFLKMYQHRSYVMAFENTPKINGMFVDENEKGMSLRQYKGALLLGGGSHRTGKNGGGWNEISSFAKRVYPNSVEICRWATQDCMTLDDIPYIGMYSKNTPGLYVATGFNKWGMTSAMTAALVLKDVIQDKENKYQEVFSPSRSMLHPQLAINVAEAVAGLVIPKAPRCPHMGCALKYNHQEHSWDCSCHGSRFDKSGKLINNPANDDLKL